MFDSNAYSTKEYYLDEQQQSFDDYIVDHQYVSGEMITNVQLNNEIMFPKNNDYLKLGDSVVLNIQSPKSNQKFMFLVYQNLNDLLLSGINNVYENIEPSQTFDNEINSSDDYYNEHKVDLTSTENEILKNSEKQTIINSNIISFKINDKMEEENLRANPIELNFKHLRTDLFDSEELLITTKCSFWKYDKELVFKFVLSFIFSYFKKTFLNSVISSAIGLKVDAI